MQNPNRRIDRAGLAEKTKSKSNQDGKVEESDGRMDNYEGKEDQRRGDNCGGIRNR